MYSIISLLVFDRRQPESEIGTSGNKHHIFRIELNTLNRIRMIAVENANFETGIRIPHVHFSICTSREDKLRVRTERSFDRDAFVVVVTYVER